MNDEINGHGYYTVIPLKILLDESLNPKSRLLFGVIGNLSNQRGYCFASNSYLAKVTGWHHKTVSGFVNELVKHGYLIRFDEVTKTGLERRLSIPQSDTPPRNDGTPSAKRLPSPPRNGYDPHREMTEENNYNIITKSDIPTKGQNKPYVIIRAKYANERTKKVTDLRKVFAGTGQLDGLEREGWVHFDAFVSDNPAAMFNDTSHLYNAFRKFCIGYKPPPKKPDKFASAQVDFDEMYWEAFTEIYEFKLQHDDEFREHFEGQNKLRGGQPVGVNAKR